MERTPEILLVNPWITDFAAHDLWAMPLGLLLLAALLRDGGCGVHFIDCLDRDDPVTAGHAGVLKGSDGKYGTGKYPRSAIHKPEAYGEIPRTYYRYGIHPESFRRKLEDAPKPDLIWVTSMMTYWYPGVREATSILREFFPETPIWLGGVYARLCPEHALESSGADRIVTSPVEGLPDAIESAVGFAVRNKSRWSGLAAYPAPALDLLSNRRFAPLLTSLGCPFRCPYCASGALQPRRERLGLDAIHGQITRLRDEYGIADFAFYDDALLLGAETTLKPALERLCREGPRVRFHTPNALHIRALSREWCELLYESGFTTLRLGLETASADKQRLWGGKVETEMFFRAVENLRAAGFSGDRIGVYLLCGLPGQSPEDVAEAIRVVRAAGATPHLAEYSPIPRTPMWAQAAAASPYPIDREPLYHNNSFFACRRSDFTYDDLLALKEMGRQARRTAVS